MAEGGIDGEVEIPCAGGGEKSVHDGREQRVQLVVGEVIRADPDARRAGVVAEQRAVSDAAAGEIAIGDGEAGIAEDGEVETVRMSGIVLDGGVEPHR